MIGDSELAMEFRKHFVIKAFPMLNPDGVVNGHWRHNAMGVDLNRDWQNFNQPETRAVRDALSPLVDDPTKKCTTVSIFIPPTRISFIRLTKKL